MINPRLELRRVAGEVALLLSGVYVLVFAGMGVGVFEYHALSVAGWLLFLVPAAAFVPSALDAVRLLRIEDPDETKKLWWRSLLAALAGTAMWLLLIVAVRLEAL
jgi:hypothetical protein